MRGRTEIVVYDPYPILSQVKKLPVIFPFSNLVEYLTLNAWAIDSAYLELIRGELVEVVLISMYIPFVRTLPTPQLMLPLAEIFHSAIVDVFKFVLFP